MKKIIQFVSGFLLGVFLWVGLPFIIGWIAVEEDTFVWDLLKRKKR